MELRFFLFIVVFLLIEPNFFRRKLWFVRSLRDKECPLSLLLSADDKDIVSSVGGGGGAATVILDNVWRDFGFWRRLCILWRSSSTLISVRNFCCKSRPTWWPALRRGYVNENRNPASLPCRSRSSTMERLFLRSCKEGYSLLYVDADTLVCGFR